ncbi:response regulator, partial [Candidatus Omnitrophota bacterium]
MKQSTKTAKKHILVIDDEPEVCSLLNDFLGSRGFKVDIAHNGEEALSLIKQKIPDLITLDVVMPVMGGFEFLENLRAQPAYISIPVIML